MTELRKEHPTLNRFLKHKLALISIIVVISLIIIALLAPVIAPYDPGKADPFNTFAPPSSSHILGTEQLGRDVFSRVLFGARVSIQVAFFAAIISTGIGTFIGVSSAFYGGIVDTLIQRVVDWVIAFPPLIIVITLSAVFESTSIWQIIFYLGFVYSPGVARLVRSQTFSTKEEGFIEAAKALGTSSKGLMVRHIMPNVVPIIVVAFTLNIPGAILTEASLSFLGLGVPPTTPSLGSMIRAAQTLTTLDSRLWVWAPPGILIIMLVLGVNFIGD